MKPDLYSVEPDGTKTDKWIFEELLGDDPVDADYAHNIDAPVQATDTYRGLFNLYSPVTKPGVLLRQARHRLPLRPACSTHPMM